MQGPLKPRVLGDVAPPEGRKDHWSAYDVPERRVNLSKQKRFDIPVTKYAKLLILLAGVAFFVFGSANSPTIFTKAAGDASSTADVGSEQAALEAQLAQLQGQIDQYQGQVTSYEQQ